MITEITPQALEEFRSRHGLTYAELAVRCGLDEICANKALATIRVFRYATGQRTPDKLTASYILTRLRQPKGKRRGR